MNHPVQPSSVLEPYLQHPDAHLLLNSDGVILAINQAAERAIGGLVNPLIGAPFAAITAVTGFTEEIDATRWEGIRRFHSRLVGTTSLFEFTLTPVRGNAARSVTAVSAATASPITALLTVLVAMRPVNSEAPRMLAQNSRFENLGTLAAGIAHDLNNALTPILLSSQLLLQNEHNETNRRLLRSIESSAIHGAKLITRVLHFVRGVEPTSLILDAGSIITAVVERMRERACQPNSRSKPPSETDRFSFSVTPPNYNRWYSISSLMPETRCLLADELLSVLTANR